MGRILAPRTGVPAGRRVLPLATRWRQSEKTKNGIKMKINPTEIDRSGAKWLPGAMALAATAISTQAATVQITLTGNKVSTTGGENLHADLTGDGIDELEFGQVTLFVAGAQRRAALNWKNDVNASFVGLAVGDYDADPSQLWYRANLIGMAVVTGEIYGRGVGQLRNRTGLFPITFSDTGIRGGLAIEAWVEVQAFNSSLVDHTVEFTRVIFNDASTTRPVFTEIPGVLPQWGVSAVPEPSGFLATSLLLGAAGLIRRRQAKAA